MSAKKKHSPANPRPSTSGKCDQCENGYQRLESDKGDKVSVECGYCLGTGAKIP